MIVLLEGIAGGTTDKQESWAHTRKIKPKPTSLPPLPSAMIAPIAVALAVGFLGWAYQALKPPPPKICGSPDGPPITSPRVKLVMEGIWPTGSLEFQRKRLSTRSLLFMAMTAQKIGSTCPTSMN